MGGRGLEGSPSAGGGEAGGLLAGHPVLLKAASRKRRADGEAEGRVGNGRGMATAAEQKLRRALEAEEDEGGTSSSSSSGGSGSGGGEEGSQGGSDLSLDPIERDIDRMGLRGGLKAGAAVEEEEEEEGPPRGICVECEDQPASRECQTCGGDVFCDLCFHVTHRKGKRRQHKVVRIGARDRAREALHPSHPVGAEVAGRGGEDEDEDEDGGEGGASEAALREALRAAPKELGAGSGEYFVERAKYIPVRLDMGERKMLRLMEAALSVSEYTDKIDIVSYRNKQGRIHAQLKDICAILSGLLVASDYKKGQQLVTDRTYKDNAEFFQALFEIGRRHKVMNPEKMRGEYGKLVYMLQDSQGPDIQELLEFRCVVPLKTVHRALEGCGCVDMLRDPVFPVAVGEIDPDGKRRYDVQVELKAKARAVKVLLAKYGPKAAAKGTSADALEQLVYSVADNHAFLTFNRDPVDKMIGYLKHYFGPGTRGAADKATNLSISQGSEGARLSHGHEKQYSYVLQTLTLWREVLHDMFRLWYLAEEDLLDSNNKYRLSDTGQGLNRVQQAPRIYRAMHQVLSKCQAQVGGWVGSSVIHLGDHNVPNALMFIDKYTQISAILNPIVITVKSMDKLVAGNPDIAAYVKKAFGDVEGLRVSILRDFFRHGFDGSGADNFFDAGSCVDGRLTSAWNFCNQVHKKRYYPAFQLAGFEGFNGSFK